MARKMTWCLFIVLMVAFPLGCEESERTEKTVQVSGSPEPAADILTSKIRSIPGPKRTVAVGDFNAIGSFKALYGDMDIGGGLGAMTTTALVESDCFIVLERANINQVLAEQEMKAQGLTKGSAAPDLGKLTGAQLLLYGSVTEFGEADKGGGLSFGFSCFSGAKSTKVGVSPQWSKGSIAMDIRVVDATTGRIIKNFKVSEKVSSEGWSLQAGMDQISVGNNFFTNTPLGQAARRCITKVVDKFASISASRPWEGRVVEVEDGVVFINAGEIAGVKKGDCFKIMRVTKTFADPETGLIIGQKKKELGRIEVNEVQSKMSTATYVPLATETPARGDFVVIP